MNAAEILAELDASGLRGRGGAGFPTGRKWRTVLDFASDAVPTTVVVNAAEGEPGTFKDRTIIRNDPYQVIEGALIAAHAVGAEKIIIGTKQGFSTEVARLRRAVEELADAGWTNGVAIDVHEGPHEYLYGEETALLETIDGRFPFPRIAPPYRRGVDEVVETDADATSESGLSAHVEMAGPSDDEIAPPALVDNVETFANIAHILARGAEWFRTDGTEESPGTMVVTVTGATQRSGVGEIMMGTPLRQALEDIGGGARDGRRIIGILPGVSNSIIGGDALDTPISFEGFAAIGSGLGSAGFIVFDDGDDMVAAVAGASRFLAVESCGQCTPCKIDGVRISELLAAMSESRISSAEIDELRTRVSTVADQARCSLAAQHQTVATSLLERYPEVVEQHASGQAPGVEPTLIAELLDILDGRATYDERHRQKQPDWTFNAADSGELPAARLGDHREPERLED